MHCFNSVRKLILQKLLYWPKISPSGPLKLYYLHKAWNKCLGIFQNNCAIEFKTLVVTSTSYLEYYCIVKFTLKNLTYINNADKNDNLSIFVYTTSIKFQVSSAD